MSQGQEGWRYYFEKVDPGRGRCPSVALTTPWLERQLIEEQSRPDMDTSCFENKSVFSINEEEEMRKLYGVCLTGNGNPVS